MGVTLKFSISINGDQLHISMRGDFDEDLGSHLAGLASKIETSEVVFDAEKIELIHPVGAKQWINFIQGLVRRSVDCRFENCSSAFVEACGLYQKFVPQHAIMSLLFPVECQCSYRGHSALTEAQWSKPHVLEGLNCPKCGGPLHAAVNPDEFLQCVRGGLK